MKVASVRRANERGVAGRSASEPLKRAAPLMTRIFGGYALSGAAVLVVLWMLYLGVAQRRRAGAVLARAQAESEATQELTTALFAMDRDYRDYLVTGEKSLSERYQADDRSYAGDLVRVKQLAADDPVRLRLWQDVSSRVDAWQRQAVDPEMALRQQGTWPISTTELAQSTIESRAQFEGVRRAIKEAGAIGSAAPSAPTNATSSADMLRDAPLALVAVLILALALILHQARSFVAAVGKITLAARSIIAGDLSARIRSSRSDEAGQAADCFDAMVERLETLAAEGRLSDEAQAAECRALQAMLDGIGDPVYELDRDGTVLRVNDAACRFAGRGASELLGRHARDVFHWTDRFGRLLEDYEYLHHHTLSSGDVQESDDVSAFPPGGSVIPLSIRSAPVRDGENNVIGVVEVVRDVSRERAGETLKDHIISLVSHELRTPIGHIKGFASSLLEPDVDWDAKTQRDFIAEIDREADRLASLVRDLLEISKIEAGTAVAAAVPVKPVAVTQQALKDVQAATAHHHVVTDVPDDLPPVLADAGQLERVVGNLVENAAKYCDPETEIRIEARATADVVNWNVTDQGPGIPPGYRDSIFDKFVRVRTEGSRKPGTGLGLAICRGIVEAHGGHLWLESPPEGGSRFVFSIPRAA